MRIRVLAVGPLALGLALATVAAHATWVSQATGTASAAADDLDGDKPTGVVSGDDITVSWTPSAFNDGTTAAGYTVRRYSVPGGTAQAVGAGCAGTVAATSCTEQDVAAGNWQYTVTPHYLTWTGTESAKSATVVVVAVVVDSTAPTTTATSSPAANGAGWHNADVSVTLTATDPAPGAVKQVTYSAAGAQPIGSTTVPGSTATVPAITTAGTTTVSFFAQDVAGNVEATRTLVVKLDKVGPTAALGALPARVRNGQSVSGTYVDATSGVTSVTYYWCTDATVACDGASGTVIGASSTAPYAVAWTGQPADGSYKVVARATDAAGNSTLSNTVTTTVDNTRPTIESVTLSNKAGGTAGRMEEDDTIVVTFSEAPDLTTMCAAWTGSAIGAETNNAVTVTVTDGGTGADTVALTVANAQCSSGFSFGTIDLGGPGYVTGTGGSVRYRGNSSATRSVISWDAANLRLTILLGAADPQNGGTLGTVPSPGTRATYTPSSAIKDLVGNSISGTASTPATSGSTAQQF